MWQLWGQLRQLSPGWGQAAALRGSPQAPGPRDTCPEILQLISVWPGPQSLSPSSPLGSSAAGLAERTRPFPWCLQLWPQLLTPRGCSTSPRLSWVYPHPYHTPTPCSPSRWRQVDLPPSPAQHPLPAGPHPSPPSPANTHGPHTGVISPGWAANRGALAVVLTSGRHSLPVSFPADHSGLQASAHSHHTDLWVWAAGPSPRPEGPGTFRARWVKRVAPERVPPYCCQEGL